MRSLVGKRQAADSFGVLVEPLDVLVEVALGRLVDHRSDIGREIARIAELERAHGPRDHGDHLISDVLLDEQHPQGRAALARTLEGRRNDVAGHLLGQRR